MSKEKYPSPDPDPEFIKYWRSYIPSVTGRENFNSGHLFQLEILCSLHKEHKKLQDTLDITGYTYMSEGGRNGQIMKPYPEVTQMNSVRNQIIIYTKMLGLTLVKDTSPSESKEANEWED